MGKRVITHVVTITAVLLLIATPAWAGFIQSKSRYFGGVSSLGVTFDGNVTAGSCIAFGVGWDLSSTSITGVSDNLNGAYTQIDSISFNNRTLQTWYFKNAASGSTTVTATWPGSPNNIFITAHEFSCDTTAPLDQHITNQQSNPGTLADAITSGSVTTMTNGQYIFGVSFDVTYSAGTYSSGTGYTPRENQLGDFQSEDAIQSAAGSIAATFANTNGGATSFITAIATFKAAGMKCYIGGGFFGPGCM